MIADEERRKAVRTHREHIRSAVEMAAESQGSPGVAINWVCFAEISSLDDQGEPCRTLFIDSGDTTGWGVAPWTITGIVEHAMRGLDEEQMCAGCPALGEGGD